MPKATKSETVVPSELHVAVATETQFGVGALETVIRTDMYERCAESYVNLYSKALENIELCGDESVLEVGCGLANNFIEEMVRRGHRGPIYGTDVADLLNPVYSIFHSRYAKQGARNVELMQADVQNLPFEGESMDIVAAFYMLYHVGQPERALREISRTLKPGGIAIFALRSKDSLARLFELGSQVSTSYDGYGPIRSPYLHFSAEDAPDVISNYFDISTDESWPQALTQPGMPRSVTYQLRLNYDPTGSNSQDWRDYRRSIADFVYSDMQAQARLTDPLQRADVPDPSHIRARIDEIIKPIFAKEALSDPYGFFTDTVQESLIIARKH